MVRLLKNQKNPLDDIDITEPNWQEKNNSEVRKNMRRAKGGGRAPRQYRFCIKSAKSIRQRKDYNSRCRRTSRGQAHQEFVNPTGNNEDAYYHYKDYAYAASDSKDQGYEFPNPIDAFGASVVNAVSSGSNIKDKYGEEITGMSVVEVKFLTLNGLRR